MKNILILEDDPFISADIKMLVDEMNDFYGFIASNILSALKIVQNNSIKIAICDIKVKGEVDGIDIAFMLQNLYNCQIIFLTSFKDEITLEKALKVDFSGYILKPFREEELITSLKLCAMKSSNMIDYKITDEYYFDQKHQQLFYNNQPINLTAKEQQLFLLLLYSRGKIVPLPFIDEIVWCENNISDTTRRQLLHRLKSKLFELSFKNIKFEGYMMEN